MATILGLAALLIAADAGAANGELAILPPQIVLRGPAARQRIVVERVRVGQFVGEAPDEVALTSSDPRIVAIDNGLAVPIGDGKARIEAKLGDATAVAEVVVEKTGQPFQWSFRNHVQSVLAKFNCSSGACHGAAAGKKGFKLSLRGYDAEGDFFVLTRQARSRRVLLADPGRSLLLTKPTATIPHAGGERFPVGSHEYQVLAEWIAAGATGPRPEDARIERIEIFPGLARLEPQAAQQLVVRAHFSDGRVEDVTRWTKYTSANLDVVNVDESGKATAVGNGQGAIVAWYLNKLAIATLTVPYAQKVTPDAFAKAQKRNFIDDLVLEKLASLNLPPSGPCTDAEFLRRAYLDATGTLPGIDETRRFLADAAPDKRDRLIEELLSRPEYVDYWTYKFSDLLLVNSERLAAPAMWAYYNWIRQNVAANTPWDQLVRQLVTAQGSTLENGAANFFVLHQDPRDLTETISAAFLGMSIVCARCHNHPLEKWTNDEYFGMLSLVSRVQRKDASGEGNFVVYSSPRGEVVQPLAGKPQAPRPLDSNPIDPNDPGDRRRHLADWLTAPDNPYFTRAIVNRIWANFFAVGLVEPADDLRLTNPPSNEKLFTALCAFLVENRYDLKALIRLILQSKTYQRSSVAVAGNAADMRFYARYYPRRLMAEVLIDSVSQVARTPGGFPGYPGDWRALQLPDSKVASTFLDKFGRPDRDITCECARANEPSDSQALHLANGDTINHKLAAKGNRIDDWLAQNAPSDRIVDEAYLAALARLPTAAEKTALVPLLADQNRRAAVEDLLWGILTSKEFLLNH